MANSKKRRKLIVFAIIAVILLALTLAAVFKKSEVVLGLHEVFSPGTRVGREHAGLDPVAYGISVAT